MKTGAELWLRDIAFRKFPSSVVSFSYVWHAFLSGSLQDHLGIFDTYRTIIPISPDLNLWNSSFFTDLGFSGCFFKEKPSSTFILGFFLKIRLPKPNPAFISRSECGSQRRLGIFDTYRTIIPKAPDQNAESFPASGIFSAMTLHWLGLNCL